MLRLTADDLRDYEPGMPLPELAEVTFDRLKDEIQQLVILADLCGHAVHYAKTPWTMTEAKLIESKEAIA